MTGWTQRWSCFGEGLLGRVWHQRFVKVITRNPFCSNVFCLPWPIPHPLLLVLAYCWHFANSSVVIVIISTRIPSAQITLTSLNIALYLFHSALLQTHLSLCLQSFRVHTYYCVDLEHLVLQYSSFLWVWTHWNSPTQTQVPRMKGPKRSCL